MHDFSISIVRNGFDVNCNDWQSLAFRPDLEGKEGGLKRVL